MYPADFGLPRTQPAEGGSLQLLSSRLAFSHQENLHFAQAFPAKQVQAVPFSFHNLDPDLVS